MCPGGQGGWITSFSAVLSCSFDFLQSWHQFNSYYEFKKNYFLQKEGRCFPEVRLKKPPKRSLSRSCPSPEGRNEEETRFYLVARLAVVANAVVG